MILIKQRLRLKTKITFKLKRAATTLGTAKIKQGNTPFPGPAHQFPIHEVGPAETSGIDDPTTIIG